MAWTINSNEMNKLPGEGDWQNMALDVQTPLSVTRKDGDVIKIWVRAMDAMGNEMVRLMIYILLSSILSFQLYGDRVSIMVCLLSIGCVTSYGKKNSNLTSFSKSNSVFSITSSASAHTAVMGTQWNKKAELQSLAKAAAKCSNAELSPEEMRVYMREFLYQRCTLWKSAELKGISDYKEIHFFFVYLHRLTYILILLINMWQR